MIRFDFLRFNMSSLFNSTVLVLIALSVSTAQLINSPLVYSLQAGARQPRVLQQGPPIAISDPSELSHPAVVENAIRESALPPELLKSSRFYSDPRTAAFLAKDSWLTDKESPVFEREADRIPREQVLKIFKNAGFVRRR